MVSVGQYLLVPVLVILVNVYRTSAQTCSSCAIELKASPNASSYLSSQNYPSSQVCCWKITAPAGHVVELTFLGFYMEGRITMERNCEDLTSEYLAIYDGNYADKKLLGRYCSTFLPPKVFSSATTLFLEFKRGTYSEIGTGFGLEYSATIPKPDSSICSPFNTYSQNNNIQLSGSSGYIESPLYGTKYPSNIQCTWVIRVSQGKKIKLTFLDFNVGQDSYYCLVEDEYLEIRDGQSEESHLINQYCSSSKPSPVHSTGRYLWIRFKSNSDNYIDEENGLETNGFKAKFDEEMTEKPNLLVPSTKLSGMSEKQNYQVASTESSGMSDGVGAIIGFVTALAVVIIAIAVCAQRMRRIHYSPSAQSSYPSPGSNPMSNSGGTPQPSAPSRFVPSPPVDYSSVPQRSYPRFGSNPMSTSGGTAQHFAPSRFVPPPPVDYSSVPQRSYPRFGSNPMSTSGGTAQHFAPSRFVPPPPVDYSSVLQRSYPPSGSYPMSTNDGTAQPSAPMNDHPSSTILNDPPPAYSEVVPDVPPPPYPGISPHPPHIPTSQHHATS